jgi:hypothetical protein
MRTIGFHTHVFMAIAAAAALFATLSRPWYAPAPEVATGEEDIGEINGPLDGFFRGFERWITESTGTTAWNSLDELAIALAVMAGIAALGALMCLVPLLQGLGRELLRYAAFAAFAIAIWKLLDPPGSNGASELRYGAFAAAASATVLLTSGIGVANAPLRRRKKQQAYVAPAPPAFEPAGAPRATGSVAPPGH